MVDSNSEILAEEIKTYTPSKVPASRKTQETQSLLPTMDIQKDDDTDQAIAHKRKQIGLYRGEIGKFLNRGIKGYESEWAVDKEVGNVSFDQLLLTAMRDAELDGRKEVVVFDFGTGEGRLFEDFIYSDSESLKFIKEHPDFNVKLIGLTDTPGLNRTPENKEELENGKDIKLEGQPHNVSLHIDYYAVTAAQSLEDYFISRGIGNIDLAFAVQSFSYLPSKNFESTVKSIVSHLRPNGTLIAAQFASRVPGFDRDYFGGPTLDFRNSDDNPSLVNAMRTKGFRFIDPNVDINQELEFLKSALEKHKRLGSLSDSQINEQINAMLPKSTRIINKMMRRRPQIEQLIDTDEEATRRRLKGLGSLMYDAERKLGYKKMEEEKKLKEGALETIKKEYEGSANVYFGNNVIKITKS